MDKRPRKELDPLFKMGFMVLDFLNNNNNSLTIGDIVQYFCIVRFLLVKVFLRCFFADQ